MPCSLFYGFNAFVYWSAVASSKASVSVAVSASDSACAGLRGRDMMWQDMAGHVGLAAKGMRCSALLLLTRDKKARIVWALALGPVSCPVGHLASWTADTVNKLNLHSTDQRPNNLWR